MTSTMTSAGPERTTSPAARRRRPSWAAVGGATLAAQVGVFVAVAALWEGATRLELIDPRSVPPISEVVVRLAEMLTQQTTWVALANTLGGWGVGLGLSIVLGTALGVLIGSSQFLVDSTSLLIDVLRSVPAAALIFVLVVLLGTGFQMKVLVVVSGALWPILIQALYGVRAIDPVQSDLFTVYQISRKDRLLRLRLPAALPYVATGVRVSASIALIVTITAEFLGGAAGMGKAVEDVRAVGDYPGMYALILLTGLLGVGLNASIHRIESRVLRWHESHRGEKR